MKFATKGSQEAVKNKITKIDPLKRMWIFGTIILIFSIFAEPKLIPAILVFMLITTFAQHRARKKTTQTNLEIIKLEQKEIEEQLKVVFEHIESGHATLEEKLIQRELEEEMEILEEDRDQYERTLDKILLKEEKFKNFLAHFKKPSKMITAGKKEETNQKDRNA